MKKVFSILVVFVFCMSLNSCRIYNLVYLQSFQPRMGVLYKYISDKQDTVFFRSSWDSNYPKLYEPGWEENDTYPVYTIRCSKSVKPYCIRLETVSVTECGEPLPISVFYKPNGLREDDYNRVAMADSIPFSYNPYHAGYDGFYIKIKKRQIDIREMTIRYRINIDGRIIEEEHQYRRAREIYTKNYVLYRHWLRTCEK